ncbi:hypothetical protein MKX01_009550 [Papaver californicum]|nr:hypothetical protein MKX01_009550 [Papaver californicum]
MVSRSCINILDLASGDFLDFPPTPRSLPRVMTVPGVISDLDGGESYDGDSDTPSCIYRERKIIVAYLLPLHAQRDKEKIGGWSFSLDEDSLLLQMKDGFTSDTKVIYVGCLKKLLEDFGCVPTFLPPDLQKKFYHKFCKQQLWPLFHYMLPISPDHGDRFNRSLWQAYVSANKIFADKVMYVWVHDYHLMILPTFLRKRFNRIYRTLPVRDEILKSMLNSDLIGFHTFDYARHFLSCCSRMLGLDYESKWGHIGLEYFGRTSVLNLSSTRMKVKEIQEQFKGKNIIVGVDDMDIFKGISLKLLAMEQLLQQHSELQGHTGKDVQEAKKETYTTAKRINETFGSPGYVPVILIDHQIPLYETIAYYFVAECCIVNAVRDGMNLVPYKYVVCKQGSPLMDEATNISLPSSTMSMLVVSEFIGCSPSLSGAIRVNPWDVDAVADALNVAITSPDAEKQLRHEKHYRYVSTHDVAYWARSFMQDLERACKDHFSKRCWGIGFGLGFRVVSLSPNFRKLSIDHIVSIYKRTNRRAIYLCFEQPCSDPKNIVFIISGRGKDSLGEWFTPCEKLGVAAEHGYFIRMWGTSSDWETCNLVADFDWKRIAEPVMQLYTETTDGSFIEVKESALVWHHQDADPDFGSCQAKELLDHLENVLANEPVVVKRGQHIVEVKPHGVSKGLVAEKLLSTMVDRGQAPDFVLCTISTTVTNPSLPAVPGIFAFTVGQKPSKAKYYIYDTGDVVRMLRGLAATSNIKPTTYSPHVQVSFESAC